MARGKFRVLVAKNTFRRQWFQSEWRYHIDDLQAYLSKNPVDGPRDRVQSEAAALALIRAGKRDGEVAEQCGLRLREVERLRLSIGLAPTAETYAPAHSAPEPDEAPPPPPKKAKKRPDDDGERRKRPEGTDARSARDRVLARLAALRAGVRLRAFGREGA